jgi:hypothetical protein
MDRQMALMLATPSDLQKEQTWVMQTGLQMVPVMDFQMVRL